jgi:uncharacterized membrane protein YjfL (UPF0719 family)
MNMATLLSNLAQSVIFSLVGVLFFLLAFFLMTKIAPFSIRKEIEEDQNTSLGILMGSVMIGLAIIIAASVHGG